MTGILRAGRTADVSDGWLPVPLRWRDLPLVLMYHTVATVPEDPHQLAVTPGRFEAQLRALRRLGLRGVGVGELLAARRAGRGRRLVGITFDDGYTGVLEFALPLLRHYGFGATAFVLSGRLGGDNGWDPGPVWPLLSADGVRGLAAGGIEIGSHGARHVRLAGADPRRLVAEVTGSRSALADLLGTAPAGFAYPYGSMDAAARVAVWRAGYRYACAVDTPRAARSVLALPRVYVGQRDGGLRLAGKRLLYHVHHMLRGG